MSVLTFLIYFVKSLKNKNQTRFWSKCFGSPKRGMPQWCARAVSPSRLSCQSPLGHCSECGLLPSSPGSQPGHVGSGNSSGEPHPGSLRFLRNQEETAPAQWGKWAWPSADSGKGRSVPGGLAA